MIPVSLSLRNFLSYGEGVPPLDFTTFHVACISGRNGHGKSALLDAVTWALWGEARKAGVERNPNEGLLRIGATEMQVTFEFNLEAERYRVSRSYRKTGRASTTHLELQVFSPGEGAFKTLSEAGSIRKTQQQLNALLRMTYDTFINSAFILQGRANEFTKRNARERKAILGDILGLSRYDDLAGLARARLQQAALEVARAEERLSEIEEATLQKADLRKGLEAASERLDALEKELAESETRLEALHTEQARLEGYRGELDGLKREGERLDAERADAQTQVQTAQKELSACQEILGRKEEILRACEQQAALQSEGDRLQQKQQALRPLEERQRSLEKEIDDQRREVERRLDEWELRVSEAEREIGEAEEILKDRAEVEAGLENLSRARETEKTWEDLREKRETLETELRDRERRFEAARSDLQVSLQTHLERQRQAEGPAAEQTRRQQAVTDARSRLEESQKLEQERDRIREIGNGLKVQIETDQSRLNGLEVDLDEIQKQQAALQEVQEARCPLCGSDLDAQHRSEAETRLAKRSQALLGGTMAALEQDIQTAEAGREEHRRHYQEVKNRLAALKGAAEKEARAEAALREAEKAAETLDGLKVQITGLEAQAREVETAGPEALALSDTRSRLETLGYDPEAHRALRQQLLAAETLEAQKARIQAAEKRRQNAAERLPDAREKWETARLWLVEKRYASKAQNDLLTLQREIETLAYDTARHDQVVQTLETLRDAAGQRERLQAAEREMSGAETRLQAARTRIDTLRAGQAQAGARTSELETLLKVGETTAGEVREVQDNIREKRSDRDRILQERTALETRYNQCEALEASLKEEQNRLKAAEKEARIHRELVTAFGKDGIQALIIEQAIPEIEEEANRILARLTDNRTQVALESLRDLKKGGTRETLDIQISDELGERRYELYSGGEAFRIDFAVRIALSKLLASRTGTRLRTLVIDEGFGTQDTEGLGHLVEAIQAISEDFEKILVITHVEALKGAFPVHIEVTKYPDAGSRFEVLH